MELIGFLAAFLMAGAVGFRGAALKASLQATGDEGAFARTAAKRAALLGLLGAVVATGLLLQRLPELAERRHLTAIQFVTSTPMMEMQVGFLLAALLGFLLATRARFGWLLASIGVLLGPLRAALVGQPDRVVNPVHELAAGLWIGTLAMLVFVGIAPALRSLAPERRGPVVARLVNGFSPLALTSAALLATMGVITAWRHLKRLDALWTTPYGGVLIAKLVLVAVVLSFGAFNWRRQKPKLGSEAGATDIHHSAIGELTVASVVLLLTAVLVSLPSPK
jgi:putative copper export protein